ncbi:DUF488 family protein [Tundrisphaera lichenicola]|uniref:DUF488 family protein n=1 Tax=Tundrisphaera lichenicola TaxID=2029860 RepID=UPI003EBB8764
MTGKPDRSEIPGLWLAGYGHWPVARRANALVEALAKAGVTRLVDVRLSPSSSDPVEGRPYGPRPWNLQARGGGIVGLLERSGIAYEWLVELGNPQRRDPAMTIIREHLADPLGGWPVHRGLALLADRVRQPEQVVAILCACGDYRTCHRLTIARALAERYFGGSLVLRDLSDGRSIPDPPTMGQ